MKHISLLFLFMAFMSSTFALATDSSSKEHQPKSRFATLFGRAYACFPEADTVKKVFVAFVVLGTVIMPFTALFALPLANAKMINYYQPSIENDCIAKGGKFEVMDSFGVDPNQLLKIQSLDLNQGTSNLCSIFSGYILAQMHEWKHDGRDLPLPDLLARGADDKHAPKFEHTREFLMALHEPEIIYPF